MHRTLLSPSQMFRSRESGPPDGICCERYLFSQKAWLTIPQAGRLGASFSTLGGASLSIF